MSQHYSREFKDLVRAEFAAGATIAELSRRSGASYGTVRTWCKPEAKKYSDDYHREYRNRDCNRDKNKEYRRKWYVNNKNKRRGWSSEWKAANPIRYWAIVALAAARTRAKKRGVPFSITVDDIVDAYPRDGKCPVFGVELMPCCGIENRHHSPSLDRFVPSSGYVPGNIAVISSRANTLKGDASVDDLSKLMEWMKSW